MGYFGQVHLEISHLDVLQPQTPYFRSTVMEFLQALDRKVVSDSTMEIHHGSLFVCSIHVRRLGNLSITNNNLLPRASNCCAHLTSEMFLSENNNLTHLQNERH